MTRMGQRKVQAGSDNNVMIKNVEGKREGQNRFYVQNVSGLGSDKFCETLENPILNKHPRLKNNNVSHAINFLKLIVSF